MTQLPRGATLRRDAGLYGYERRGKDKRVRIPWIPIGRRPEGWRRKRP